MIWRGSIQLGIGIAFDSTNRTVKVVANYAPPGNVIGSFPANVPNVCTGGSTTAGPSTSISTSRAPNTTASTTARPTTVTTTSSNAEILAQFQREALIQHNARRQQHCVPLMVLNNTLNTIAQNYANLLIATNAFAHSGAQGLGENLWSIWSSGTLGYINGRPQQSFLLSSSLLRD